MAIKDKADNLREALDMASDLFAKQFSSTASVELPSGATFEFKKVSGSRSLLCNGNPVNSASIRQRIECVNNLEQLWDACTGADRGLEYDLDRALETAFGFIAKWKAVLGGP